MESSKTCNRQQVVVLDKACKLAESWVERMNLDPESKEDEGREWEIQNRPTRLGLGAKFLPHSKFTTLVSPVEKKLQRKLNNAKHETETKETDIVQCNKDSGKNNANNSEEESDDENPDSKSSAFHKKKVKNVFRALETTQKQRKKRKT
eukprot:TRINITY_DN21216_c0_g1_i1.p1 TRINITY_DN21216_c0_g1~~TRINITY_DN21216_c0_g1_i1.p1  ORF type:complete len:149 (+),score=40.94 TRINITY_DN21216_c0_g1_i1:265-711(+)